MADTIKTNLGPVTAYADAKAHGYTGTREEFGQLLANAGLNLKAAETAKEGAEAAKQAAETSQQAAAENQKNAGTQAANAKASADTAAEQADAAKESATGAANSASAAQKSEISAGQSATAAANAEAAAKQAQQAAETAKTDAEAAKTAAGTSADAAAASAADAKKTLESIPDDYSTLSGKVDENTNGIRELKEDTAALKDGKISKFYASSQGETHLADSDSGKIQDMTIYGRSSQFTTTGKNLANGQNVNLYINGSVNVCGYANNDSGMAIDVSKLTNVTISTRSIQDRYRAACVNTVPQSGNPVTCHNGKNKDGTKDSYTIDTTDYNYLIVNATKLDDIQVEEGAEATSYEPYTGGQSSPSPNYPQEIKSVVNPTVKVSNEDGTESQTVALPYTLNAIPVSSGGNVTIDGQQYITDYVDVEKKKRVEYTISRRITPDEIKEEILGKGTCYILDNRIVKPSNDAESGHIICSHLTQKSWNDVVNKGIQGISLHSKANYIGITIIGCETVAEYKEFFKNNNVTIMYQINPTYSDLQEEISELATYYPATNVSFTSAQLDGYAVFNYPISMTNGWNYVKQQLNDNRDYIYDMDTKTQDIDTQSAEAYVNSEYAVALTELEV